MFGAECHRIELCIIPVLSDAPRGSSSSDWDNTSKPGMSKAVRQHSGLGSALGPFRYGDRPKMRYPRTSEKLNLGADLEHACVGSLVLSEHVV